MADGEAGKTPGAVGIALYSLGQKIVRLGIVALVEARKMLMGARHVSPSVQILHVAAARPLYFGLQEFRRHGGDDALRNLVLHLEHIFHVAFIIFGPDVAAARAVDHLSRDAHLLAHMADASRQHIAHVKLGAHPLLIDLRIAVAKARITGDDKKLICPI